MAGMIEADNIDLRTYLKATDAAVKVRKASMFAEDLQRALTRRKPGEYGPHMRSTKLGADLEFRPGEVTVWAGYNKHKKSMFTGQVALDLCCQDQRVLVASLEMQPYATLARMCCQATAEQWPDAGRQADFMRWTDGKLWLFDHVGRLKPELCLAVLRYFADELQGQHAFIDSIMKVCQSEESLDEQKMLMSDLCDVAKETGLHIHLVAHCRKPTGDDSKPPTRYDLRGSSTLSDLPHNIVTIWANRAKNAALQKDPNDVAAGAQPDALITVEGQRNGAFEGRISAWLDSRTMRFVNDRMSRVEPMFHSPL